MFRENDEKVGIGAIDKRIKKVKAKGIVRSEPSPQEKQVEDKTFDFFLKLAGDDQEIDWMELKELLDFAMKNELSAISGGEETTSKMYGGLNAAPSSNQQQQQNGFSGGENNPTAGGLLQTLLSLICTSVCKDTPLAELIPAPQEASQTMATYHEVAARGFSKDICRSMVAMLDADKSGKLGYDEFKELWTDIRNWKEVFKLYDKNNSGSLNGFEMRQAFNSAGYRLNNHILNILMHRYGNKNCEIEFDDFIMCAVKLNTMMAMFNDKDVERKEVAEFTLEEWIENTLYS